jgi:hypothetical protein
MAKTTAKLEIQPQTKDVEQFQLFLDGARKRGMNESLQDFALKFFQDHCGQGRRSGDLAETQVVRSPDRPSRASRFCTEQYCLSCGASTNRLPYFPQHKS